MFQVASLILWSLDEYYYYAVCIFLISLVSITTTLVETRAVSHLICNAVIDTQAYSDRQCRDFVKFLILSAKSEHCGTGFVSKVTFR